LILYLDTSTFIKLYVDEPDSALVEELVRSASQTSSSQIAYAEMHASMARARRLGRLTNERYEFSVSRFEERWDATYTVEASDALIRMAGALARAYPLRGFDAVHLASAVTIEQGLAEGILFSSADSQLLRAAEAEGLAVAYDRPAEVRE
jgi:predicted nucleic acid-binding protein